LREYTEETVDRGYVTKLVKLVKAGDTEGFIRILEEIFHQIPYDIRVRKERYYQSIFYLIFILIGVDIETEVRTDRGRIDAVMETVEKVYIMEFKLRGSEEEALEQIKEKRYWEKYEGRGKEIELVGVKFQEKGISDEYGEIFRYKVERL